MARANQRKKRAAPKRKPLVEPRRRRVPLPRPRAWIPECTRKYALARFDPFNPLAMGACIPDETNVPSMKVTMRVQGFAAPGTTGHGFVSFDPRNPTSNIPCITRTTTTSVGSGATALNAFTFLNYDSWPNALLTSAQFSATGFKYRVVGAGLRVAWAGPKLYQSGRVHGANEPDAGNIDSYTLQETVNFWGVTPKAMTNKHHQLVMSLPDPSSQLAYSTTIKDASTPEGLMVIGWSGMDTTPAAATVYFEAIAHYEIIGKNAAGTSPSETDGPGFVATQSAVSVYDRQHSAVQIIDKVSQFIIDGTSRVLSNPESSAALGRVATRLITAAAAA